MVGNKTPATTTLGSLSTRRVDTRSSSGQAAEQPLSSLPDVVSPSLTHSLALLPAAAKERKRRPEEQVQERRTHTAAAAAAPSKPSMHHCYLSTSLLAPSFILPLPRPPILVYYTRVQQHIFALCPTSEQHAFYKRLPPLEGALYTPAAIAFPSCTQQQQLIDRLSIYMCMCVCTPSRAQGRPARALHIYKGVKYEPGVYVYIYVCRCGA